MSPYFLPTVRFCPIPPVLNLDVLSRVRHDERRLADECQFRLGPLIPPRVKLVLGTVPLVALRDQGK